MNTETASNLNSKSEAARPDARDFLDAGAFLQAVFAWRQGRDHRFSYTSWAQELGFNSRVFLRLMVLGKRKVTEASLPLFIAGLKLKNSEGDYFAALVRFCQATTVTSRERYARELRKYGRTNSKPRAILDHYRFLSSWFVPAVQSLLSRNDLNKTPENLAALLGIKISEVAETLENLQTMGLAREENGQWVALIDGFQQNDELGNVALQAYHRKSLEHSIAAIETDPRARRFQSLLTFLSQEELEALNARVVDFLLETLAKQTAAPEDPKQRLYQIHFSMKPVSKPLSEPVFRSKEFLSAPIGSQSVLRKEEENEPQ